MRGLLFILTISIFAPIGCKNYNRSNLKDTPRLLSPQDDSNPKVCRARNVRLDRLKTLSKQYEIDIRASESNAKLDIPDAEYFEHARTNKGNLANGRKLLMSSKRLKCYSCHFESKIAPNLMTIKKRFEQYQKQTDFAQKYPDTSDGLKKYVTESILTPSAFIAKDYATTTLVTNKGRTYSGLVTDLGDGTVVLHDSNENTFQFNKKTEIDDMVPQNISVMPQNLHKALTTSEFTDLVAIITNFTDPKIYEDYAMNPKNKGNMQIGKGVFENSTCTSCHYLYCGDVEYGPNLDGVPGRVDTYIMNKIMGVPTTGKVARRYIVESILYPNKVLAPKPGAFLEKKKDGRLNTYGSSIIKTREKTIIGQIWRSDGSQYAIVTTGAKESYNFRKSQVHSIIPINHSIMPIGLEQLMTPKEFNHLVEYIAMSH